MSPEKRLYFFAQIGYIGHRPIPDGTKVVKPNRYTAYQSPLLTEEPSGFFTQYSETLPSFAQDFIEVTLAYEDLPRRAAPSCGAC